jgi:hypothetical protein
LAAATVLGLGAIAAAEPNGFDGFRGHPHHSHSQFDPRFDPESDPHMHQFGNAPPPPDGRDH